MPIYEYECRKCHKNHEIVQKHTDAPPTTCPECGGKLKKLISNTSFVLKGTGWYKTDYAPAKKGSETEKEAGATSTDAKKEKSEAKPEATSKAS